ncbi:arylsulfatase [Pedobacter psychrophilus]|uniref:Arylsulfatase n=1 Tax=Pedobacter psychrophilus TaxID=1826909 RepID=A0A179DJ18_9SPHI|nr:arylsulfatase [Pedobacter psychrophilus]OAQ40700.1 arylsulfatase [Pedobacter psychrophilus]
MKKILYILLLLPFLSFAQTKKPNIIIILADDLGWGDVGYHGSTIKTPNIDKLSKDGVILNRFYAAPICSPTRAGLLIGRYPNRVGIRETTIPPWSDFGLDTEEVTLPDVLTQAGYTNRAIIGKWHLGHNTLQYHPMRRGFTHFYGHLNGAIDYFTHKREGEVDWHNDYEPSKDKGYSTNLLSDEAVKCIKQYSKESAPFFMYLAYNAPHGPLQAPDEDLIQNGFDPAKGRFSGTEGGDESAESGNLGHGNTPKQTYAAMVTNLDKGIGRVLKTLKDQKIDDNTLILFMSDNGAAGNGAVNSHGELRGYKFEEWEGGVRVPAIVKWPSAGLVGGKQIEQVMGYIDVLPTFKAIAGVTAPSKLPLDGINMWPVLSGKTSHIDRQFYLGHGAIIDGDWKLIKDLGIKKMRMTDGDVLSHIPPDYSEKENLRTSNPEMYKKLLKEVAPYEAIEAKEEILSKGPKKGFKAPKDWKITKEK